MIQAKLLFICPLDPCDQMNTIVSSPNLEDLCGYE